MILHNQPKAGDASLPIRRTVHSPAEFAGEHEVGSRSAAFLWSASISAQRTHQRRCLAALLAVTVGALLAAVVATLPQRLLDRAAVIRDASFTLDSGERIRARLYLPRSTEHSAHPGVIVAHGFMGNLGMMELTVALPLVRQQFVVLSVDRRGHGQSEGTLWPSRDAAPEPRLGELDPEMRTAIDKLRRAEFVDPARIGLLGHSDGARASILSACADWAIQATVAISGTLRPAEWINHVVPQNLLLVYGEQERFVSHAEQRVLLARATDPLSRLAETESGWLTDGTARALRHVSDSGHLTVLYRASTMTMAVNWLAGALDSPRPPTAVAAPPVSLLLLGTFAVALLVGGLATLAAIITLPPHSRSDFGRAPRQLHWQPIVVATTFLFVHRLFPWTSRAFAALPLESSGWFAGFIWSAFLAAAFTACVAALLCHFGRMRIGLMPTLRTSLIGCASGGLIGLIVVVPLGLVVDPWYSVVPSARKLAALPILFGVFLAGFIGLELACRHVLSMGRVAGNRTTRYSAGVALLLGSVMLLYGPVPAGPAVLHVPFYACSLFFVVLGLLLTNRFLWHYPFSSSTLVAILASWVSVIGCPLY